MPPNHPLCGLCDIVVRALHRQEEAQGISEDFEGDALNPEFTARASFHEC